MKIELPSPRQLLENSSSQTLQWPNILLTPSTASHIFLYLVVEDMIIIIIHAYLHPVPRFSFWMVVASDEGQISAPQQSSLVDEFIFTSIALSLRDVPCLTKSEDDRVVSTNPNDSIVRYWTLHDEHSQLRDHDYIPYKLWNPSVVPLVLLNLIYNLLFRQLNTIRTIG